MTRLREMALVAEAWAELAASRARLRLPRRLGAEGFLRRELSAAPPLACAPDSRELLLRAFDRALRAQPGAPGCLPRALALRRFLRRHGEQGSLGLGLKREGGRLRGHAWIELGSEIVGGEENFVRSFRRLRLGAAFERA